MFNLSNIILLGLKGKAFSQLFQSKIGILNINPLSRKNMIKLPNYILVVGQKEQEVELKSGNDQIQSPGTRLLILITFSL